MSASSIASVAVIGNCSLPILGVPFENEDQYTIQTGRTVQ
jgi:hypothetical protein